MMNNKSLLEDFKCFDRHSRTCSELMEKKVDTGPFNIHEFMTTCSYNIVFGIVIRIAVKLLSIFNDIFYISQILSKVTIKFYHLYL